MSWTGATPFVDILRGDARARTDLHVDAEVLATGSEAIIARHLYRGHLAEGGGEVEIEVVTLNLMEDERPRTSRSSTRSDVGAALARFEEIGAQTEPERLRARICRLMNARDYEGVASCYAEDHELVDHRALSWDPVRGGEAVAELIRSWVALVPDVEVWFETLASDERHIVVRIGGRGHAAADAGEGSMQYDFTLVSSVRDGQMVYEEVFAAEDEASALARYEELRRTAEAAGAKVLTPREHFDRVVAATNAHDWSSMRALMAPDVRVVDRRPIGWADLQGRDAFMETYTSWEAISPGFQLEAQPLALGGRASVIRSLYSGYLEDGGGEFEVELVALTLFDDGQSKYVEIFPADDAGSALERFEEIGAQTDHERLFARLCRARNARDWDAVSDCFAADWETIDHRVLAWEPLRGPGAMVDMYRSWDEVTPDVEVWFETLAGGDRHSVFRHAARGHAADGGGAMEYGVTMVVTVHDGRFQRAELFEAGDEAAALARFEELNRADTPTDRPVTPREVIARYVAANNARDWDALRAIYTPGLRFIDRRLVGWGELEGPDAVIDAHSGCVASPQTCISNRESLVAGSPRLGRSGSWSAVISRRAAASSSSSSPLSRIFEDGLVAHVEMFDGADAGSALRALRGDRRRDGARAPARPSVPLRQRARLECARGLLHRGRRDDRPPPARLGADARASARSWTSTARGSRSRPTQRSGSRRSPATTGTSRCAPAATATPPRAAARWSTSPPRP